MNSLLDILEQVCHKFLYVFVWCNFCCWLFKIMYDVQDNNEIVWFSVPRYLEIKTCGISVSKSFRC